MTDLKIESLDDLFEDDNTDKKEEPKKEEKITIETEKNEPKIEETKQENIEEEAPILPQEEEQEVFSVDIQKELEAKFDELFGPMDEDE